VFCLLILVSTPLLSVNPDLGFLRRSMHRDLSPRMGDGAISKHCPLDRGLIVATESALTSASAYFRIFRGKPAGVRQRL